MSDIFQIFSGHFELIELIVWVCLTFGLWALFLFIAYKKYPPENNYTIKTCTISFLGVWTEDRNPKGWYYFSIGMSILSVMLFPLLLYLYNRVVLISYTGAIFGLIMLIIGDVGIILIAIFPDNEGVPVIKNITYTKIHFGIAVGAFGCFGVGFLRIGWLIIWDGLFGARLYNTLLLSLPFFVLIFVISMTVITQIKWAMICKKDETKENFPGEGIYSFPLWEWALALTFFFGIAWVLLFLPN